MHPKSASKIFYAPKLDWLILLFQVVYKPLPARKTTGNLWGFALGTALKIRSLTHITNGNVMTNLYSIPQLPDINSIIQNLIESEVKDKVVEWAQAKALAAAKSIGGAAALADNVKIDVEMVTEEFNVPSINVGTATRSFSFSIPEVKMVTKTLAELHVPETYMQRDRLPINHKQCKVRWKMKKVGFGIKTKVPELVCWETPAYADVPKIRMVLKEFKSDVPEITMKVQTVSYDEPTFNATTIAIKMQVPKVKSVNFDVAGMAKDFIPGGSILFELLELLQEADAFRQTLQKKINDAVEAAVLPIYTPLKNFAEEVNAAIERVNDRYSEIIAELDHMAGDHSEEIRKQNAELSAKLESLTQQLLPLLDSMRTLEKARLHFASIANDIKLI